MTWETIEQHWSQFKGVVQSNWPKLSDKDIAFVAGNQDRLRIKVQQQYLLTEGEANGEIAHFLEEQELAQGTVTDPMRAPEQPPKNAPRFR
jgi:uncharacterized protein YjbJ (UPF0337 family)